MIRLFKIFVFEYLYICICKYIIINSSDVPKNLNTM